MRLRNKCALLFVCLLFCKGNEITTSKISFCDFTVILNIVNERSDSVKIILHQKKKHFGFITGDNSDNSEADGAKWFDTLFVAANDSVLDTIQSNSEPDENRQIKT